MIRRIRPLLAVLLAAAIAGAPLTAAASVPMDATEVETPAVTGTISEASPSVLEADSTFTVTATLDPAYAEAFSGHQVHLRFTDRPLKTHEQIEKFLESPESYARHTVAESMLTGPSPTDTSDSSTETTVTLTAEASDLELPKKRSGVYGVTVTVIGADGAVTVDSMVVTWAPVDLPTLQVATVATVTASESRAEAIFEAANVPGVTMLVDPTLTDSRASEVDEFYRIPAANVDLTSLARAGDSSLVEYAVGDASDTGPSAVRLAPLITPVAVADRATVRAAVEAGAEAVILERRFGVDSVTGGGDAAVVDVKVAGETIPVIRPDEDLSAVLGSYPTNVVKGASRLVAESALKALYGDDDLVVVSPGQSWSVSGEGTSTTLEALLSSPWVEAVPLSTALEDEDRPRGKLASATVGAEDDLDAATIDELAEALAGVQVIASTATDPDAALEYYALRLAQAVSLPSRAGSGTRAALVSGALTTAQQAIDGVSIASSADINFIAAEGSLPVTLRNTTSQELTVVVAAKSDAPELQIIGRPEVTIAAGSEAVVQIPVRAVSSANVEVEVTIRTDAGDVIADPQTLTVRVRADWGNAATLVFSLLLVLLLIAGVIRTIRRGRRDTRVKPSELDAPVDESAPDTESRDNT
ncbi:DUF6049 family protein [Demequina salsinemoris]|uniref:DUF6049 family protein n=1 Tax=Demequina salsinemoris TaxID=577470 RepID=UPI000781735E|nr:DUF6049 family protein [Demequina salsinemoris]